MSGFLSYKYLAARVRGSVIDDDRVCDECGYALRGLRIGGQCPECGTGIGVAATSADPSARGAIASAQARRRSDPFLTIPREDRPRILTGARIVLLTIAVAIGLRLFGYVWMIAPAMLPPDFAVLRLYVTAGIAAAFALGVTLLLPMQLAVKLGANWGRMRHAAVALVWLFPASFLVFAIEARLASAIPQPLSYTLFANGPSDLFVAAWVLRLVAGGGVVLGCIMLSRAARDAELDEASARFSIGAGILPVPMIIIWCIPASMPWIAIFLVSIPVFVWAVAMIYVLLAVRAVSSHLAWDHTIAKNAAGRDERLAARRAEIDQSWKKSIRALPSDDAASEGRRP